MELFFIIQDYTPMKKYTCVKILIILMRFFALINELICVANSLDLELGVSIEEAKVARKLVNRAIKASKDKIDEQRVILEKNMQKYLALGKEKLEKVKAVKVKASNKAKEELEFSKALVSNGDFEHLSAKVIKEPKCKTPKWVNAAKKAGY